MLTGQYSTHFFHQIMITHEACEVISFKKHRRIRKIMQISKEKKIHEVFFTNVFEIYLVNHYFLVSI